MGDRGLAASIPSLCVRRGMWLMPCFSHFIPRKETWYVSYKRLGGPQGQVLIGRKMSDLLLLV